MKIRWTRKARAQWAAAYEYVFVESPAAAERQTEIVIQAVEQLSDFPEMGRIGRIGGTRELVIHGTPYIAIYRLRDRSVRVLALLHSARRWPTQF